MKKLYLPVLIALLFSVSVPAQNTTFNQGDKVINLGVGFGSNLYSGSLYTNRTPPISASIEFAVKDELFDENSSLGVGGYFGYTGAKWESMGYGWNYNSIIIGGRGALHYQFVSNLDTYVGLMLGYNIVSSSSFGTAGNFSNSVGSGFTSSWFIGGRYYFTDNLAALLEVGYGVANLTLGVALRL